MQFWSPLSEHGWTIEGAHEHPRNHRVEEALAAASDEGDLAPLEQLLNAVRQPYDEAGELAPYAEPAAAAVTARCRTLCGT